MKKVLDRLVLRQTTAGVPSSSRNIVISSSKGKEVFRQNDVSVPEKWSDAAIQIAASRWFRGKHGTSNRETGVYSMFRRVAYALTQYGIEAGYLDESDERTEHLFQTLIQLQLEQKGVFNTPVYLNAGWTENPRCSACFLIGVEDNYESLTAHSTVEGRVFQHGGGAGVSISHISHEGRKLGRGGVASGPLCFNEGWDRASGAIKSGGSHRRAARDVTMDVYHPDCYRSEEYLATLKHAPLDVDFIREKQVFEDIRRDLQQAGHDVGLTSLINYVLPGQNANRAVGVVDEFMDAVLADAEWDVKCPRTGDVVWTYPATEIFDALCFATWRCADPTVKFLSTINEWNTTPVGYLETEEGRKEFRNLLITMSNPCNEVLYPVPPVSQALVACNLAMLRLTEYLDERGDFNIDQFVSDASMLFAYQDMIVDYSSYPTELGDQWTRANRIIGLSMSDLGGLLMKLQLPYDSDEGRNMAGAVCALLLGSAMLTSAELAEEHGCCEAWTWNAEHAHGVMSKHLDNAHALRENMLPGSDALSVLDKAMDLMEIALGKAKVTGFRNMQFVSLAPQGTTGLITDCYATGPEPLAALLSYKALIGGGYLMQAPACVKDTLVYMIRQDERFWREACLEDGWYGEDRDFVTVDEIYEWAIHELTTYGRSSFLEGEELKIFETALGVTDQNGEVQLALSPESHVDMLAALQPFVSGAISKTVNLPRTATVEDIKNVYLRAWKKKVKAIAIYRDGSKGAQVIVTKIDDGEEAEVVDNDVKRAALTGLKAVEKRVFGDLDLPTAYRVKLPDSVASVRKKIELNGHKIYLHIGLYENGGVGEIYLTGVQGSFVSGMLDSFAVLVSLGLQYGIPFETLYSKFESVEFSPNGLLKGVGFVSSFPSAVMKILKAGIDSGEFERFAEAFYIGSDSADSEDESAADDDKYAGVLEEHVPRPTGDPCSNCGALMVQSGRCKYCVSCGANTGGCG